MGNLHAGHLELVRQARSRAQRVVVSIFVNPMQFGANEDFDDYPRTLIHDQEKLQQEKIDLLYTPTVHEMYPRSLETSTRIEVPEVSEGLCNDFRPGHFTGVATVVARLFNLIQPDIAIFGEKDYQQLAVIRRMVEDLAWPIDVQGVATVREADGLAMSSRNQYLEHNERVIAPLLYQQISALAVQIRNGNTDFVQLETQAMQQLNKAGFTPEYVCIRHADTLQSLPVGKPAAAVVLAAARLGETRLIDNIRV